VRDADGAFAVRLARHAICQALGEASPGRILGPTPSVFVEPRGVFVTLRRHPGGALRGCIGYPLPVLPLREAIVRAAVSAATADPRFPSVRREELGRLALEVSVLTVPVPVPSSPPEEAVRTIRVGRDGLIVEGHGTSGLLLPQVAVEQGWSVTEFLDGTCEKAGLPPGAWRLPSIHLRRFEAEVFREESPEGPVVREGDGPTEPREPLGPRT
jgi:hypothetical protein